jgi:hypothetical protein
VQCSARMHGKRRKREARKGRLKVQARRKGTWEGLGAGLQCMAGMHTNGKNPLPRETRVTHFGEVPKGPAGQSNGSCSSCAPPTTATPAMIHHARECGLEQDSRLIGRPYRPNEDPLQSGRRFMSTRVQQENQARERLYIWSEPSVMFSQAPRRRMTEGRTLAVRVRMLGQVLPVERAAGMAING